MKIPYFIDLNAPTSKIQISLSLSPNFMTQILSKSTCDNLSNDIMIIFFERMVRNNSLVKDGILIIIQSIMIPFLTLCADQIDFQGFKGCFQIHLSC